MAYDSMFDCPRCEGKGKIAEFRHIKGGICFLCNGAKKINKTVKYNRKGNLICQFTKGHVTNWYPDKGTIREYREVISFSFDGGRRFDGGFFVTDENKEERRDLWRWFKNQGAEMIFNNENRD